MRIKVALNDCNCPTRFPKKKQKEKPAARSRRHLFKRQPSNNKDFPFKSTCLVFPHRKLRCLAIAGRQRRQDKKGKCSRTLFPEGRSLEKPQRAVPSRKKKDRGLPWGSFSVFLLPLPFFLSSQKAVWSFEKVRPDSFSGLGGEGRYHSLKLQWEWWLVKPKQGATSLRFVTSGRLVAFARFRPTAQ